MPCLTILYYTAVDIVMPIPETSRTSALQVAATLQRPYREGFVKNRYIARTFIMPVPYYSLHNHLSFSLLIISHNSPLYWRVRLDLTYEPYKNQSRTLVPIPLTHALHCTALHCPALHCPALHCPALPCPVHPYPHIQLYLSSHAYAFSPSPSFSPFPSPTSSLSPSPSPSPLGTRDETQDSTFEAKHHQKRVPRKECSSYRWLYCARNDINGACTNG